MKRLTPKKYFYITSGLLLFVALIVLFCFKDAFYSLIWNADTSGICPDFFESINDAKFFRPYERGAIYPALVYLLSYPLTRLLPSDEMYWTTQQYDFRWLALSTTQTGSIIVIFFFISFIYIYMYILAKIITTTSMEKMYFVCIFLLSPGCIFMLDRGNIVIIAAVFTAVFVMWKDNESSVKRELAFVCLAIAACFKIYPALFGMLLLLEKRWKDSLRCIVYGLLTFAIPFSVFGGTNSILLLANNVVSLVDNYKNNDRGFGFGYRINALNYFDSVMYYINGSMPAKTFETVFIVFFTIICITILLLTRQKWIKVLVVTYMIVLLPGFSYSYTLIYLFIPLAVFLSECDGYVEEKIYKIYAILLAISISPFPYGWIMKSLPGDNKVSWSMTINGMAIFGLILLLFIVTVDSRIREWKYIKIQ